MLSEETLHKLWSKISSHNSKINKYRLISDGLMKLVRDEDPELASDIKKLRAHDRRLRNSRYTRDAYMKWVEEASIVANKIEKMCEPYVAQWEDRIKQEQEDKQRASVPKELTAYVLMYTNNKGARKFWSGGDSHPSLYWNKQKALKNGRSLSKHKRLKMSLNEVKVIVTDQKMDLED